MPTAPQIIQILSEATFLRLYNNNVTARDEGSSDETVFVRRSNHSTRHNSLESMRSCNEFNNSCRICRWNRSDMELAKCPCLCKGSVGFIHLSCLKKWIMHRRDNHCEICNASFNIPEEKLSIRRMLKSLFYRCAGPILKQILFSAALIPLTHIVIQQVVICMDNLNLNPNEDLTLKQVGLAAGALMISSALFFNFFEFITMRLFLIRNILRHWWLFGNSSDFTLIQMESDIFDLFT